MPLTSYEDLCEACLELFSGDRYDRKTYRFTHHETAGSFGQALDLSCALCIRLYMAWNGGDTYDRSDLSLPVPITYDCIRSVTLPGGRSGWTLRFLTGRSYPTQMTILPLDGMYKF
jgi:hypothetical protein